MKRVSVPSGRFLYVMLCLHDPHEGPICYQGHVVTSRDEALVLECDDSHLRYLSWEHIAMIQIMPGDRPHPIERYLDFLSWDERNERRKQREGGPEGDV